MSLLKAHLTSWRLNLILSIHSDLATNLDENPLIFLYILRKFEMHTKISDEIEFYNTISMNSTYYHSKL